VGCLVAAGVAGLGVLLAAAFLPAQPLVLAADLEFETVEGRLATPVGSA
jgi:hypothetical protein